MKYRMLFDYHTHTTFSHGFTKNKPHGKGTIEENIKVAVEKGLAAVAISDHGPGHVTYGIRPGDLVLIRNEIERLKPLYPDIKIYLSVEANINSRDNNLDIPTLDFDRFDFVMAGYHFAARHCYGISNYMMDRGFLATEKRKKTAVIRNTDMILECLHKNDIKMLTHPGDKALVDMAEVAKACSDTNTLMEISTYHAHLTVDEIKIAAKTDVRFAISSDAHRPQFIGSFSGGLKRAMEAGIDIKRIVNIEEIRGE